MREGGDFSADSVGFDTATSARTSAILLLGSFLLTGVATALLCELPAPRSLHWPALLLLDSGYLLLALAVHVGSVWLLSHLFFDDPGEPDAAVPALSVVAGQLWMPVAWLPLLVLLQLERSPWVFLLPLLIVWATRTAVASGAREPEEARSAVPGAAAIPFQGAAAPAEPYGRNIGLAVAAACLLEAGAAALAARSFLSAGCLLAAAAAVPLWRLGTPRTVHAESRLRPLLRTAVVFTLVAVVLLPFLRQGRLAQSAAALLRAEPAAAKPDSAHLRLVAHSASGYTSVILLPPPSPHPKKLIIPPVSEASASAVPPQHLVIAFDGAYWYFKSPATGAGPEAHIRHGSPLHASIRSTDTLPVQMEAHQHLDPPISLGCCRVLRVTLQDAEPATETVEVEVRLSGAAARGNNRKAQHSEGAATWTLSLGPQPLRSSPQITAAQGRTDDQVLDFPFPVLIPPGRRFDGITVGLQMPPGKNIAGAHVAVKSFELVPRE